MLQQGTRRTSCSEGLWPWRISISIGKLLIKADGAIYPLSIFHFLPFLQLLNFRSSVSDLGSQHSKSHSQFTWNWNSVLTNWNMNLSSMPCLPLDWSLVTRKLASWTLNIRHTLPLSAYALLCSWSSYLWSLLLHLCSSAWATCTMNAEFCRQTPFHEWPSCSERSTWLCA